MDGVVEASPDADAIDAMLAAAEMPDDDEPVDADDPLNPQDSADKE